MLDYAAKKPFSTCRLQNNQSLIGGDRCLYNPKAVVLEWHCLMGLFAHIGRKHQYTAPCTGTTSILYWHYKHLVLALQASCTRATKYLVLTLQSACSVCTNSFSQHCQCCCFDTWMAKWGMLTHFLNSIPSNYILPSLHQPAWKQQWKSLPLPFRSSQLPC